MDKLVYDEHTVSKVLSEIEKLLNSSRNQMDVIIDRNKEVSSYNELSKSKDLVRLYGNCADDYAELCYIQTGVSEAIMDLRTVKKMVSSDAAGIPPTLAKTYKYRIDVTVEQLNLFKEAVQTARMGLEARVRFFNSCSYTSYDKVIGAKC